jgi:hypothetical protein
VEIAISGKAQTQPPWPGAGQAAAIPPSNAVELTQRVNAATPLPIELVANEVERRAAERRVVPLDVRRVQEDRETADNRADGATSIERLEAATAWLPKCAQHDSNMRPSDP